MKNVEELVNEMGLNDEILHENDAETSAIVYLRNEKDYKPVKAMLCNKYSFFEKSVFVEADICKKKLGVEIEIYSRLQ